MQFDPQSSSRYDGGCTAGIRASQGLRSALSPREKSGSGRTAKRDRIGGVPPVHTDLNTIPTTDTLVLASASPIRSRLLQAAGAAHQAIPAALDERMAQRDANAVQGKDIAVGLARRKALTVSSTESSAWTIGCDQVLECGSQTFDKPADATGARDQLLFLRGRTHTLWTAACVARQGCSVWMHVEAPRLTMRRFSDSALESYLRAAGPALQSPGAYHLEGLGVTLFERVEGDYFSILGLPLVPLLAFLRQQGALPS